MNWLLKNVRPWVAGLVLGPPLYFFVFHPFIEPHIHAPAHAIYKVTYDSQIEDLNMRVKKLEEKRNC